MKYFKEFNKPDSIISVCSYPDPKHGIKELNAVAWHSERTLKPLAHDTRKIIVIAEQIQDHTLYKDGPNMLVLRDWKKGNIISLLNIVRTILKFNKVKSVLFQFEFNIFGGIAPVLALPFMLPILKLAGKRINFEIHQVILDIGQLANHVNIQNILFQWVFNLGLRWFYFSIGLFADEIIVLEEDLKKRLHNIIDDDKIVFVPIAIQKQRSGNHEAAKKKLGLEEKDFCILVFGFINWYKGSDWIVKAIQKSHTTHVRLIMAGGENPTLKDKPYYQKFYKEIEEAAKHSKKILLTGFVSDSSIKDYFSAADVVILPYRVFMSASGPFSFALSYKKPILLSNKLYDYSKSDDFAESMQFSDLEKRELFFPMNYRSFNTLIAQLKHDEAYDVKLSRFSKTLGDKRSTEQMVKRLEQILIPAEVVRGKVSLQYS